MHNQPSKSTTEQPSVVNLMIWGCCGQASPQLQRQRPLRNNSSSAAVFHSKLRPLKCQGSSCTGQRALLDNAWAGHEVVSQALFSSDYGRPCPART
eukprot:5449082-Amphidinium_carterae.1